MVNISDLGTVNGPSASNFGDTMMISKDGFSIVVGARDDSTPVAGGTASVYYYSNNTWSLKGNKVTAKDGGNRNGYGVAINANGSIFATTQINYTTFDTAGVVRVYQYVTSDWQQKGSNITTNISQNRFGNSLALNDDGTILAIQSLPVNSDLAYLRIYKYTTDWNLMTSGTFNKQYKSLSFSSDGYTLAANTSGLTYLADIYRYTSSTWSLKVTINEGTSSPWGPPATTNLSGQLINTSISLNTDGTIVAIGDWFTKTVKVCSLNYSTTPNSYSVIGTITSSVYSFGFSVSLNADGNRFAVSAPTYTSSSGNIVVVYDYDGSTWSPIYTFNGGTNSSLSYGCVVSFDRTGSILAIAADNNASGYFTVKQFLKTSTTLSNFTIGSRTIGIEFVIIFCRNYVNNS